MSLVIVEDLELAFGGRSIISGLDMRIGEEDRIGLVGRNGSGKSSLLRILAGEQEADGGTVRSARGVRVGYLPQEIDVAGGRTLIESVVSSVPGRDELEQALEGVEEALAGADQVDDQMALSEKLATLHDDILHFDSHYSPHEAASILSGLGFRSEDHGRDVGELSGGWRMRAMMAALLFQKPDLLMLDEPTNHLDVPTVRWLGDFLKRYPNALILICHDREFLNEQINRVVAYEAEGVRQYPGNYENYRRLRAEELEILERRSANLARERETAERFITRFRAQANKARAVQSRVKALEKLDDVVIYREGGSLSFRFPPCARTGQDVVRLQSLGHRYGETPVFTGADLTVRRGDKIAIIGPNGAGKTTLLKLMAGEMEPAEGEIVAGHNVAPGYYAQHVTEKLSMRSTVFEEVWRNSVREDITYVRNVLGTFLFSADDVDKKIAVLSGGEKARVALARLMVDPGNLLLMDEPTNHLDLESSEALAQALTTYDGTLVFVSHNRSFVNHLATRIWHVHDGLVEEFPGTLAEFFYHLSVARPEDAGAAVADEAPAVRAGAAGDDAGKGRNSKPEPSRRRTEAKRKGEARATDGSGPSRAGARGDGGTPASAAKKPAPPPVEEPAVSRILVRRKGSDTPLSKDERIARREERKEQQRQERRYEKTIADLEIRIAEMEDAQAKRSEELSQPNVFDDAPRYNALLGSYQGDAAKLEELMARWEQAQAALAALAD